ncbi:FtsK/SpoIIIE domain-containing protein [Streptomyces sp. NPDC050738]|uniref:FtsK/SpoIIIE domain-containing protein n=1 Tax=Streptomyces sp. NPDC050738 TaxID=3154744 RepID=UPI0034264C0A
MIFNSQETGWDVKQQHSNDDLSGQMLGTLGALVLVTGLLAVIKDKLGLSWWATMLLVCGVLVGLGYLAWRLRRAIRRLLAGEMKAAVVPASAKPEEAATEAAEAVPIHEGLTTVMTESGAISADKVILLEHVSVKQLDVGTLYDFMVPKPFTYKNVAQKLGVIAGMFDVTELHLKLVTNRENDRCVRLLVLDEPPFTKAFDPPTRNEIQHFAGVPIGHDVTGELVGVTTFSKASLLVGGMTQMGKTTLINGLITCLLLAYGEFDLYLLDGKLCGLTTFEPIAVRYEASDDPAVLESMLDELNARVASRYEKMQAAKRNREPIPKFKPIFFIIDEAADFYMHDGTPEKMKRFRRVEEGSRVLVSKALESETSVIMLTQRPSQDAIPVIVRSQFLLRLCLYVASSGNVEVTMGDDYFKTVAPVNPTLMDADIKGQGVFFERGRSTLIRGFDFPEKFIWDAVDEVKERQQRAIEKVSGSPITQAIEILEGKGVDFMSSQDLAPFLGIMDPRPGELGKKIKALLGVEPGKGGERNVRGYWLNDLRAAAKAAS